MSNVKEAKEVENGERLAKMEQKTDNIERLLIDMNENIKTFTSIYVPRTEIELMFKPIHKEIDDLKNDLEKKADTKEVERIVKQKDNWYRVLPAWVAIVFSVVTFLLMYFK